MSHQVFTTLKWCGVGGGKSNGIVHPELRVAGIADPGFDDVCGKDKQRTTSPPPRVGFFISFLEFWSTSQHRLIAVTASLPAFAFRAPLPEGGQLVWFRFANIQAIVSYVFKCLLQLIHALRRRPLPVFCLLLQACEWLY